MDKIAPLIFTGTAIIYQLKWLLHRYILFPLKVTDLTKQVSMTDIVRNKQV
jgi:hypothetical protein